MKAAIGQKFYLANPCVEDEAEKVGCEFVVKEGGVFVRPRYGCAEYQEWSPGKLLSLKDAREVWTTLTKQGYIRKPWCQWPW